MVRLRAPVITRFTDQTPPLFSAGLTVGVDIVGWYDQHRKSRSIKRYSILLMLALTLAAIPATVPASDGGAGSMAGEVLIAGGDSVKRCSPCLHPENTWFVGDKRGFTYTTLTSAEIYKPADGVFVRAGNMGAKLAHPIATVLGNHNVLVSGWTVRGYVVSARIGRVLYHPAAGSFLPAGQAASSCGGAADEATVWTLAGELELKVSKSGRRELYQDGVVSGLPADCVGEILNVVARVSEAVTPGGQATLLPDGKVLVSRAPDNFGPAAASRAPVEIYNPATGEVMPIGQMRTLRSGYSVSQLKDGRLLIAGGHYCKRTFGCDPGTGTILDSAEIYDPKNRRFTSTGKMARPRYYHSAVLVQDGRVLLAGGQGRDGESLASAEVYDPSTGRFSRTGAMTIAREHAAVILLH
jgi:Galactose oxidase, central domain